MFICRRNRFPVGKRAKVLSWANGIRFFQDKDRKQRKAMIVGTRAPRSKPRANGVSNPGVYHHYYGRWYYFPATGFPSRSIFDFAMGSDIVAFRGTGSAGYRLLLSPPPATDLGRILAVLVNIFLMVDKRVADRLLRIGCPSTQLRHPVNHVLHQVKAVEIVEHAHVERRCGCPLFLITAHVEIFVIPPAIGQSINQPGVTVKRKNDRFLLGE